MPGDSPSAICRSITRCKSSSLRVSMSTVSGLARSSEFISHRLYARFEAADTPLLGLQLAQRHTDALALGAHETRVRRDAILHARDCVLGFGVELAAERAHQPGAQVLHLFAIALLGLVAFVGDDKQADD